MHGSRRILGATLLTLAALAGSAAAQSLPLSEKAQAAMDAWRGRIQAMRDHQAASPPAKSLEEALERRIEIDQAVRQDDPTSGFPADEARNMRMAMAPTWADVESENVAFLKSVIPADGWFRNSRDGVATTLAAFLIVQHSPDVAWQKTVLARMEPLLGAGEVSPESYALLYDRITLNETGKQRYGTQVGCVDGQFALAPMDAPTQVQERRDAIGFKVPRHTDYMKFWDGKAC